MNDTENFIDELKKVFYEDNDTIIYLVFTEATDEIVEKMFELIIDLKEIKDVTYAMNRGYTLRQHLYTYNLNNNSEKIFYISKKRSFGTIKDLEEDTLKLFIEYSHAISYEEYKAKKLAEKLK